MRDRNMGGYEYGPRCERLLWSWRRIGLSMMDAEWKWDDEDASGSVMVASVPLQGSGIPAMAAVSRLSASVRAADLDTLQRAWDTWHALIDDPATAPDAVLHWLAEVTPARETTPITDTEETT